ncbi:hypothetical protein ABMA27_003921 [Loxostege sticticalis]|uniref:Uncharacterized protein n=1 Tax=Loxostege sticticalis TaxID=481309 RepID=A0ABR3HQT8_LOXSC
MMPLRSPTATRSDIRMGMGGSQPNLSTIESNKDLPSDDQINFRNKRKHTGDEDIREELREIRKEMAEMMRVLTSINEKQTETINKMSEDITLLKGHVKEIKSTTDNLGLENREIKSNLDDLISKYKENNRKIEIIETKLGTFQPANITLPPVSTSSSNNLEENLMVELTERLSRSKNIIITGLAEQKSANYKERQDADKREVLNILQNISSDCTDPINIIRLGKYASALFVLRSKNTKDLGSVKIFSDQTPQQQAYFKKLKDELKSRNDNGEMNLTIKYYKGIPKIVKTTPKN